MPKLVQTYTEADGTKPSFPHRHEAVAYIRAHKLHAEPYGLRANGKDRYEILELPKAAPRTVADAAPRAKEAGAPTAKSICLSLYTDGISRDDFVALVTHLGVKEATARTMYSDIKAGRIK